MDRLKAVLAALDSDKSKLVIDLSCRRHGQTWIVAMNKWKTLTDMEVNAGRHVGASIVEKRTDTFRQHASSSWSHIVLNFSSMRQMSRACKRASTKTWFKVSLFGVPFR